MFEIPASHTDILAAKCYAHVATLRPDGQLSTNPVALIWDGARVRFSTTKTRKKVENLRADPRIALSVVDPDNVWRYLEIRGTASLEDDVDRRFIDQIARKYMGQEVYDLDPPGTERVTVTVHPVQVSAMGVLPELNDGQAPEDWTR